MFVSRQESWSTVQEWRIQASKIQRVRHFGSRVRLKQKLKRVLRAPPRWNSVSAEDVKLDAIVDDPKQLEFCDATKLLRFVKSAGILKLKCSRFWKHAESSIIDVSSSLTSTESIDILWVFTEMNNLSPSLFKTLLPNVKVDLNKIKTIKLVSLLWILQECRYTKRPLLSAISDVREFQTLIFPNGLRILC